MRSNLWTTFLILLPASTAFAQFGANPQRAVPTQRPNAEQGDADEGRAADPNDPQAANGTSTNAVFAAIDVDGDEVITKAELRKWLAALKKLDTNRDGNITLAEASPGEANQAGALAGPAGAPGQGAAADQGFDAAALILQYDRNNDRKLSPNELPIRARGMFRAEDDPDNNGIDMAELQAVMARGGGGARAWAAGNDAGAQRTPFRNPNRLRPGEPK